MAIMMTIHCPTCGETKQECRSNDDYSRECGACKKAAADRKRRDHLAGRKGLTVEERLELLEQWQYDHRPRIGPLSIKF